MVLIFCPQGGEGVCVAGTTASSYCLKGHMAASLAQTPADVTSCHVFSAASRAEDTWQHCSVQLPRAFVSRFAFRNPV